MGPLAPVFAGGDGGPWQPTVTTMTTANAPAINRPFNLLVVLVMMTAKAASYLSLGRIGSSPGKLKREHATTRKRVSTARRSSLNAIWGNEAAYELAPVGG